MLYIRKFLASSTSVQLCSRACSSVSTCLNPEGVSRVWVGNLPRETTQDEVVNLFQQFGQVAECSLMTDSKNRCKGFGYLTFDQPDSVRKTLKTADELRLGSKVLEVRLALSKDQLRPECTFEYMKQCEAQVSTLVRNSILKRRSRVQKSASTYILSMFPYPSGSLHIGHARVYSAGDVLARFYGLCDSDVIHPIGWDAFGLPAENAAVEHNVPPAQWTQQNISTMKAEMHRYGLSFDFARELSTASPSYYKWTQYLFLLLYKNGLAYRKRAFVNWDPIDQTVLADEQIDEHGRAWRSGALVERRALRQWFVRTSRFSPSLLAGLDEVDWPGVAAIQRNWIGACNVYKFDLQLVCGQSKTPLREDDRLEVCVEHLLDWYRPKSIAVQESHVMADEINNSSEPVYAVHPLKPDWMIPVAVESGDIFEEHLTTSLLINEEANLGHIYPDMVKKLKTKGYLTSSKLSGDWVVSRQRYWGTPIPLIHCDVCGVVPVPLADLPVKLPASDSVPSLKDSQWNKCLCPECGSKDAKRETDTLDTFFDSSWYFLRYLDPDNQSNPFDSDVVSSCLPVGVCIGGVEHACLHLYYARFMCHFLNSIGLLALREPFARLLTQDTVRGRTFRLAESGEYIPASTVVQRSANPWKATLVESVDASLRTNVCAVKLAGVFHVRISVAQKRSTQKRTVTHFPLHSADVLCKTLGDLKQDGEELVRIGDRMYVVSVANNSVRINPSKKTPGQSKISIPVDDCNSVINALRSLHLKFSAEYDKNAAKSMMKDESGRSVVEAWEKMSKSKQNGITLSQTLDAFGADITRLMVLMSATPTAPVYWDDESSTDMLQWMSRIRCLASTDLQFLRSDLVTVSPYSEALQEKFEPLMHSNYSQTVRRVTYHLKHQIDFSAALFQLLSFTNFLMKIPGEVKAHSSSYDKCLTGLLVMLHPFVPHFTTVMWRELMRVHCKNELFATSEVFDQPWPSFDADATVMLEVKLSDGLHRSIPISLTDLLQLDRASALRFAGIEDVHENSTTLTKCPDYGAVLQVHSDVSDNISVA